MNATEFLVEHIAGYADLDADEHLAIQEFTLMWTAFEGRCLGTRANAASLLRLVEAMQISGRLDITRFAGPLAYFRDRYWRDGEFTQRFQGLRIENYSANEQALVKSVLSGAPMSPEEEVSSLLLVVYRLRNNLFHGIKWDYGIKGQRDNFTQACAVLMAAIELSDEIP